MKSNYSLWELVIVDLFDHFTVETTLKAARDQFMTNTRSWPVERMIKRMSYNTIWKIRRMWMMMMWKETRI